MNIVLIFIGIKIEKIEKNEEKFRWFFEEFPGF